MSLLAKTDRAAGGLARAATTLGQVAMVWLGVHLAADRLDDLVFTGLTAIEGGLDQLLLAPATSVADMMGWTYDTLIFWQDRPLAAASAWFALLIELISVGLLSSGFLLTNRQPETSWAIYRRTLGVRAVVLPLALMGVLIAGSWSLAMAAEDLLPGGPVAPFAAAGLALAAWGRFCWPAWWRTVCALEPPTRPRQGLGAALLLVPVGALAWTHGVPLWGWLP